MRILGIDPGIATVGFGFVDQACGCALRPVQYGAITTEAGLPLATRLMQINRDLEELIETFRPDVLSVEELFLIPISPRALLWRMAAALFLYTAENWVCRFLNIHPLKSNKP